LGFPESAVETITKFSEIAIKMFVVRPMVDTTDITLDIGNERMNPGQERDPICAG